MYQYHCYIPLYFQAQSYSLRSLESSNPQLDLSTVCSGTTFTVHSVGLQSVGEASSFAAHLCSDLILEIQDRSGAIFAAPIVSLLCLEVSSNPCYSIKKVKIHLPTYLKEFEGIEETV